MSSRYLYLVRHGDCVAVFCAVARRHPLVWNLRPFWGKVLFFVGRRGQDGTDAGLMEKRLMPTTVTCPNCGEQ